MKKSINFLTIIILFILLKGNLNHGILSNPKGYIINMILILPGIVVGVTFHEFAHAFASSKLGDPTPNIEGRLTLNPAAHFDLYGLISLIFCGFGWGKPVQIDNRYYKSKRRDELVVSIAGVAMNLFLAFLFSIILKIWFKFNGSLIMKPDSLTGIISTILMGIISINIILAIFNLLPIPPLDGFSILNNLFNLEKYDWYYKIYNNGFIILLLLLVTGVVNFIISPISSSLNYLFIYKIAAGL